LIDVLPLSILGRDYFDIVIGSEFPISYFILFEIVHWLKEVSKTFIGLLEFNAPPEIHNMFVHVCELLEAAL